MSATFTYWSLEPPAQWKAGSVGAERTPFYFDCADCGAKEPPIAGILSTDGTFNGIGLLKIDGSILVKTAMFCATCYAKRITPRPENLDNHEPTAAEKGELPASEDINR